MIIKLAALGALGYAGYRYLKSRPQRSVRAGGAPEIALAGGPLSSEARLQHTPDAPA
jgi:hypothetical protein